MAHHRKLVTIRPITNIRHLKGAQKHLEVATVHGGWKVVVRKGEWKVGEMALYFEIDSFIPSRDGRFNWEDYGAMVEYHGGMGYPVRSKMYGKEISQGLILETGRFPEVKEVLDRLSRELGPAEGMRSAQEMAWDGILGVEKWELPAETRGRVLGRAPPFFRRPGCERVQNLPELFTARYLDRRFQVTEKMDGVSMTVYRVQKGSRWHACLPALPAGSAQEDETSRVGVASRAEDLDGAGGGPFWQAARLSGLVPAKIHGLGLQNLAVQGELVGPDIRDNSLGFAPGEPHRFVVFQIYDIDAQKWLDPRRVVQLCEVYDLPHVPVVGMFRLRDFATGLEEMLAKADGVGSRGQTREGLVFKMIGSDEFAFKVISNRWLLQKGE